MIRELCKKFSAKTILDELSLHIPDGSFTVLLGPSGCGKTTLLRIIAGLEAPTSGKILIGGRDVTHAEPKDRDLAMVFQNYALYPHMNVEQNVGYGLKMRKIPRQERKARVAEALDMVELTDQAKKMPANMSGGQRQRVALARAIVKRPKVFLMDEPLSNLDAKLRSQMRDEIVLLYRQLGATFVYVTHDQVEAMSMGTDIVILNDGRIIQQGRPKEIYTDPRNIFVAGFIGSPPCNIIKRDDGYLAIRPGAVEICADAAHCHGLVLNGTIRSAEQLGDDSIYSIDTPLGVIKMKTRCTWSDRNNEVRVCLPYDKTMFFDSAGNRK